MLELVAGVVVALAAVMLVVEPLVRPSRGPNPESGTSGDAAGANYSEDIEESESPRVRALLSLKEIEFDRATGKLSEEDYDSLKAEYSRRALAALKAEEKPVEQDGAEIAVRKARDARGKRSCPACGPRPEAVAVFCSACGRPLVSPDGNPRCWVCGADIGERSKYCSVCGAPNRTEGPAAVGVGAFG